MMEEVDEVQVLQFIISDKFKILSCLPTCYKSFLISWPPIHIHILQRVCNITSPAFCQYTSST